MTVDKGGWGREYEFVEHGERLERNGKTKAGWVLGGQYI